MHNCILQYNVYTCLNRCVDFLAGEKLLRCIRSSQRFRALDETAVSIDMPSHSSLYFGQQERVDEHVDLASSQRHRKETQLMYCIIVSLQYNVYTCLNKCVKNFLAVYMLSGLLNVL